MTDQEKFPSEAADRFQIRLPEGLRDRIRSEAAKRGRSMNSEIVYRLIGSLDADDIARSNYPYEYSVTISLSKDTLDRIRETAEENRRDIKDEISYTLDKSYPDIYPIVDIIHAVEDALNKAMVSNDRRDVGRLHDVIMNATHRMFVDYEERVPSKPKDDLKDFYRTRIQEIANMINIKSREDGGIATDGD